MNVAWRWILQFTAVDAVVAGRRAKPPPAPVWFMIMTGKYTIFLLKSFAYAYSQYLTVISWYLIWFCRHNSVNIQCSPTCLSSLILLYSPRASLHHAKCREWHFHDAMKRSSEVSFQLRIVIKTELKRSLFLLVNNSGFFSSSSEKSVESLDSNNNGKAIKTGAAQVKGKNP